MSGWRGCSFLGSFAMTFRKAFQLGEIDPDECLLLRARPALHLMFTTKREFVRRIFFSVNQSDRRINLGRSATSAREMFSCSLLESMSGTTIEVRRSKPKDVDPRWH